LPCIAILKLVTLHLGFFADVAIVMVYTYMAFPQLGLRESVDYCYTLAIMTLQATDTHMAQSACTSLRRFITFLKRLAVPLFGGDRLMVGATVSRAEDIWFRLSNFAYLLLCVSG
jgi:hypothetical protein